MKKEKKVFKTIFLISLAVSVCLSGLFFVRQAGATVPAEDQQIDFGKHVDMMTKKIINLGTPEEDADAVTKSYLDGAFVPGGTSTIWDCLTKDGDACAAGTNSVYLIDNVWNVGIGTNNPLGIKLNVEGNIEASGGITANDFICADCLGLAEISDVYVLNAGDTMTGPLVMSSTYLNLNRSGAGDTGIQWYSTAFNAWAQYMGPSGAGAGPKGNLTAPSGNLVTSWGLRSFIENSSGYGWTFESGASSATTPNIVAEIRASDGSMQLDGDLTVSGASTNFRNAIKAVDGSGSLIDADLLDTISSGSFLRSDVSGNYTSGILTFNSGTELDMASGSTLDVNGNLSIADTDIALDGASTNFLATGNLSINTNDLYVQKSTGNVGIGAVPSDALTVVGTIGTNLLEVSDYGYALGGFHVGDIGDPGTDNLIVDGGMHGNVYERMNTVFTRIVNPKGGWYANAASSITGAIAITLPTKVSDAMISFWVDVFDYASNESFSAFISGNPYSSAGVWTQTSATILGSNSNRNFTVRFGGSTDNTKSIVYIGETNSVWAYPQVIVRDVLAGYGTSAAEMDNLEWDVTFETTLLNIDTVDTRSNNFPYSDWNRIINIPTAVSNAVAGPDPATDNAIARFDLATGKLIQNSGVTIDDSNNLTTTGDLRLQSGHYLQFTDANTRIGEGASDDLYLEADDDIFINPDDDVSIDGGTLYVDGANNRVGIGATSPIAKLQVGNNWSAGGSNTIYLGGSGFAVSNLLPEQIITTTSTDTIPGRNIGLALHNSTATAGAYAPLLVFSSMETGVSTYNGSISAIGARTVTGSGAGGSYIDGEMMFYTAPTSGTGLLERMRIKENGNVGIGTTDPSLFKLQVAGDVGPNADSTYDLGTNTVRWGKVYADYLVGDGSGLTGLTSGDITGITTASGSGIDGGCASGTCTLTIDASDLTDTTNDGMTTSGENFVVGGGTCLTADASGLNVTADCIGSTQLEHNTGQHLTPTSSPFFSALNLTSRTKTTLSGASTYENVAQHYGTTSVGTIVITIGNTPNMMIDAEIDAQGYGGVREFHVRGYTYTSQPSWHQPVATCLGSGTGSCSVRFGKVTASGDRVIMLGTTGTSWGGYPHVSIPRVTRGYPGSGDIGTWSIAIVTDESAYTVSETASINNAEFTAATVNTGQGANELYDMNQNVLTTSTPTFSDVTASDDLFVNDFARIDALRVGTTSTDPGDGNLYVEGAATIIGKLTAGEIDPPYSIDGTIYATYGHSTTGLKEETVGKIELVNQVLRDSGKQDLYYYIIDFDETEKESDLWLFKEITAFGDDWNDLVVSLTPEGKADVWYEFIPEENKLIIYGNQPVKVSYRLMAPRFDWPERDTNLYDQTGKAPEGVGVFVR